ncbi:MAG: 50S ribosomal protein L29 [Patescibacteria group bacterium]|nr:50S ribosomal protein L29 [Patescibacteria group bacterium]
MLTIKELRKLSTEELRKELEKARIKLMQSRLDLKANQDKKSHLASTYKRYCAQILTVKNETTNQTTTS